MRYSDHSPIVDLNACKVHTKRIPRCVVHAKSMLWSTYKEVMAVQIATDNRYLVPMTWPISVLEGFPQGIPSPDDVTTTTYLCLCCLIPISQ